MTDKKLLSLEEQLDHVLKKGPIISDQSSARKEGGAEETQQVERKDSISKQLRVVNKKKRRQKADQLKSASPQMKTSSSVPKIETQQPPIIQPDEESEIVLPPSFENELKLQLQESQEKEASKNNEEEKNDPQKEKEIKFEEDEPFYQDQQEDEQDDLSPENDVNQTTEEEQKEDQEMQFDQSEEKKEEAPSQPTQKEGGMEQEESHQIEKKQSSSGDNTNANTNFVSKKDYESELSRQKPLKTKKQKSAKQRQIEKFQEALASESQHDSEKQDQVPQLRKNKSNKSRSRSKPKIDGSKSQRSQSSQRSNKSPVKNKLGSRKVRIEEEEEYSTPDPLQQIKVEKVESTHDHGDEGHVHQNEEGLAEDKTMYYNMTLSHSIAVNDEHKFNQFMKKIGLQFQLDRKDKLALSILENYSNSNFMEIRKMVQLKQIRQYYNLALKYCIKRKRDVIAFDLIKFSQEMMFHLCMDQNDMTLLLQNKLYVVIERLVFSHCEFKYLSVETMKIRDNPELLGQGKMLQNMQDGKIAHAIVRLTSGGEVSDEENDYEGGDGQQSQSSVILRQKLDSLPEGRNDVVSRVGTEAPGMRDYRSSTKKKLKKDPGRFLMKKLKAEDELIRRNDTVGMEPIQGNILNNELLDSELNNPFSEGGAPVLESPVQNKQPQALKINVEPVKHQSSFEMGSIGQTINVLPQAKIAKKAPTPATVQMTDQTLKRKEPPKINEENSMKVEDQQDQKVPPVHDPSHLGVGGGPGPSARRESMHSSVITHHAIDNIQRTRDQQKEETGVPKAAAKAKKGQDENTQEKYIQISDYLDWILYYPDLFMEKWVDEDDVVGEEDNQMMKELKKNFVGKIDEKQVLKFINEFLQQVQDCMDFDQCISLFIKKNACHLMMDELFEQTDASIRSSESNEHIVTEQDDGLGPIGNVITLSKEIFGRSNRLNIITGLINQSINVKMYEIAYEVTKRFMSDLLKSKNLPIFDQLFNQFAEDPTRYEAKLAIMLNCMPLMNRQIAGRFMKTMEGVVSEPAANHILKKNLNPLRVGLILYRVLDEVQKEYAYSPHSTEILQETLADLIRQTLEIYNDPDELMILVEQIDYQGHDCFWYLDEYDLYSLLDSRMMDRVISKKWEGKFDVNSGIMDYSTANLLYNDKFKLYATDRLFSELRIEILNFDRSDQTHYYKFHVWQNSMKLRFEIDLLITLITTIVFQVFLASYGVALGNVTEFATTNNIIGNHPTVYAHTDDIYTEFLAKLDSCGNLLAIVMYVSFTQLVLPLNEVQMFYFTYKTKRKASEVGVDKLNEIILFAVVLWWFVLRTQYQQYNEEIPFAHPESTAQQQYIGAILWTAVNSQLSFTVLMTILALNSWLKLVIRMQKTRTFGPQFKMIIVMFEDLLQFMVFWSFILIFFTCVAGLVFGNETKHFKGFAHILYSYFQTSLGSWSISYYDAADIQGKAIPTLTLLGQLYNVLFLMINNVLLLNYVIAVLSSTFAKYETKQLGLYYEVIVGSFPTMNYDERYGSIVCAVTPLNVLVAPFQWILGFLEGEKLISFNRLLCHLIYFPIGVLVTAVFFIMNTFLIPLAYAKHLIVLIQTVTDSDETMDELSEKLQRIVTIFKFGIIGLPYLLATCVIDLVKFYMNLYTKPYDADEKIDMQVLSEQTIEKFIESIKEVQKEELEIFQKQQENLLNQGVFPTTVDFVKINKRLQTKLEIQKQISHLIFDNSDDKFVKDEYTNSSKINEKYLSGIKEFAVVKQFVCNTADKVGKVDVNLLLGLVEQVSLRYKMLQIEIQSGDLEIDSTNDEIQRNILYELAKTEPSMVEAQLGDESQVMDVIDDKLENIKKNFENFKTLINMRFDKSQQLISQLVGLQMENRKKELKHQVSVHKKNKSRQKSLDLQKKNEMMNAVL